MPYRTTLCIAQFFEKSGNRSGIDLFHVSSALARTAKADDIRLDFLRYRFSQCVT